MPIFEVEANGKSYEVEAPSMEAAAAALQGMPAPQSPLEGVLSKVRALSQQRGDTGEVGKEIANAFNENADSIKNVYTGYKPDDPFGNLSRVGGAIAAIPGMAASPITGTSRHVIGGAFDALDKSLGIDPKKAGLPTSNAVADLAMMGAAPRGYSPIGQRTMPQPLPTATELKQAAKDVYNSPAVKSIQIPPQDATALAQGIHNELFSRGYRQSQGSAPGALSEVERMIKNPAASVDDLRASRRALNIMAGEVDAKMQSTPNAVAARDAINKIDDFLDTVAPEIRTANANYRAGSASETVDFRSDNARRRAAKTGAGGNVENTLRQEVDKIPARSLTPEQRALREEIVVGTTTRNAARNVGKLGPAGGLDLMLQSGMAYATSGATVPVSAGGYASRKFGEALTKSQIKQLDELIRSNSPLARALAPSPIPAPNPLLGTFPASNLSLAELLGTLRPYPSFVPSYAEGERR